MFVSISISEFVKNYSKTNPKENVKELQESLISAVESKKSGCKCDVCGQTIWAVGSGIVGWDGCFTCITGEADSSEDYEIDEVCFM